LSDGPPYLAAEDVKFRALSGTSLDNPSFGVV